MNMSNKHKRFLATIISWLLCFMFVLQLTNRAVYTHSHLTRNGIVITHAHPFNKSSDSLPYKKHSHADYEFFMFDQLNVLILLTFVLYAFYRVSQKKEHLIFNIKRHLSGFTRQKPGRSPPLVSC
jgi:hypothetical protein